MSDLQVGDEVRIKKVYQIMRVEGENVVVDIDGSELVCHASSVTKAMSFFHSGDIVVAKRGEALRASVTAYEEYRCPEGYVHYNPEIVRFATKSECAEFLKKEKDTLLQKMATIMKTMDAAAQAQEKERKEAREFYLEKIAEVEKLEKNNA